MKVRYFLAICSVFISLASWAQQVSRSYIIEAIDLYIVNFLDKPDEICSRVVRHPALWDRLKAYPRFCDTDFDRDYGDYVRQKIAKITDLKAGRVTPANIREARIAYGAEADWTSSPIRSPKMRADGKIYQIEGNILHAENKPEFMGERMSYYFYVKIPKSLQTYYFDNAKINRRFSAVGKYVDNMKYSTVGGQEKIAPVFEALYIQMQ